MFPEIHEKGVSYGHVGLLKVLSILLIAAGLFSKGLREKSAGITGHSASV